METNKMSFESLGLMPVILKNVHKAGYETPTPIQRATIPLVAAGKDVLGCAQTGTGKTAAFALPILQRLAQNKAKGKGRPIRTLILTPTRELAIQIGESFDAYGKFLPWEIGLRGIAETAGELKIVCTKATTCRLETAVQREMTLKFR